MFIPLVHVARLTLQLSVVHRHITILFSPSDDRIIETTLVGV